MKFYFKHWHTYSQMDKKLMKQMARAQKYFVRNIKLKIFNAIRNAGKSFEGQTKYAKRLYA